MFAHEVLDKGTGSDLLHVLSVFDCDILKVLDALEEPDFSRTTSPVFRFKLG